MLIRGTPTGQLRGFIIGQSRGRNVCSWQNRDVRRITTEELKILIKANFPEVYEDTMLDSAADALVVYANIIKEHRFDNVISRFKVDVRYLETKGASFATTFEVLNNHTFCEHKKGDESTTIVLLLNMEKFNFFNIQVVCSGGITSPLSSIVNRLILV